MFTMFFSMSVSWYKFDKGTAKPSTPLRNEYIVGGNVLFKNKQGVMKSQR